jgi:hypothetical protein
MLSVLAATIAGVSGSEDAPDYIRVDGQRLFAGAGREFHIRGMGTGSTSSDPLERLRGDRAAEIQRRHRVPQ